MIDRTENHVRTEIVHSLKIRRVLHIAKVLMNEGAHIDRQQGKCLGAGLNLSHPFVHSRTPTVLSAHATIKD